MSIAKSDTQTYSSERVHEVTRTAWDYIHDDNLDRSLSMRNLGQLEDYGDKLAEGIDNTERPQPQTKFIEEEMPEKPPWKASVHVMLKVLSVEYEVVENYKEGSQYSRWIIEDTEPNEIREITEILEDFTDSL